MPATIAVVRVAKIMKAKVSDVLLRAEPLEFPFHTSVQVSCADLEGKDLGDTRHAGNSDGPAVEVE